MNRFTFGFLLGVFVTGSIFYLYYETRILKTEHEHGFELVHELGIRYSLNAGEEYCHLIRGATLGYIQANDVINARQILHWLLPNLLPAALEAKSKFEEVVRDPNINRKCPGQDETVRALLANYAP